MSENDEEETRRERFTLPDPLSARVHVLFGDSSPTESGDMRTALWYACERYEVEHGLDRETVDALVEDYLESLEENADE